MNLGNYAAPLNPRRSRSVSAWTIGCALLLSTAHIIGVNAQPHAIDPTNSAPIPALIQARKNVENFFDQSTNVVCTESISQVVLGKNNKPLYREDSANYYQLRARTEGGALKLDESRDPRKIPFHDPWRTMMVTNGFASMLLIVHPTYESSYTFEPAGEEMIDGVHFVKVHFQPVPGGNSPAALRLRGKSYPIPLSGVLWIDTASGAIVKLTASVDSSLSDLGLQGMRSEIHYGTIQFHDPDESYWMPVSAVIDVETPRQHWRNIHRFTEYKRFKATMEIEMGKTQ
jgi:hypothetical protein